MLSDAKTQMILLMIGLSAIPTVPRAEGIQKQEARNEFQTRGMHKVPITLEKQDHVELVEATSTTLRRGYKGGYFRFVNRAPVGIDAAVFVIYRSIDGDQDGSIQYFDTRLMPGGSPWGPGDSHTIRYQEDEYVVASTGSPTGIHIRIDYLEFSNGSWFGENNAGMRQRIENERRGARKALLQMRTIFEREGEEGMMRIFSEMER